MFDDIKETFKSPLSLKTFIGIPCITVVVKSLSLDARVDRSLHKYTNILLHKNTIGISKTGPIFLTDCKLYCYYL